MQNAMSAFVLPKSSKKLAIGLCGRDDVQRANLSQPLFIDPLSSKMRHLAPEIVGLIIGSHLQWYKKAAEKDTLFGIPSLKI